ncbi:hypothetical protein [Ideonella alba]|uniref:Uncharacterized protein n=1 Tax=Ideonella alba TaxID=2824118 RepID=A0A940YBW3_9BURK|nr:hypothetical protein [Ideonella alba]MBQ0933684.1 hypothetical protein [Ideonella alba]
MSRPSIEELPHLWLEDGSYRDVYVLGTSLSDWRELSKLACEFPHTYQRDGVDRPLPNASAVFGDRAHTHLLSIRVGNATVNCHYFASSEIELDVDPREVRSSEDHDAILLFVERLSAATGKPARITDENLENSVHLEFDPNSSAWRVGR